MFGAIASIAVGTWIRIAVVAIAIGIVTYGVHLYNDSVRAPLENKIKLLGEEKKTWVSTHDADVQLNQRLQQNIRDTAAMVREANERAALISKDAEDNKAAAKIAIGRSATNALVAKQESDRLRVIASTKTPAAAGDDAEIDTMLDQYQTGALSREAKAKEVLGLK